ncbi:MAG: hypothetical protein HKL85_13025 [Acidimicrobiaceae bacterium]|nr:hypothetical protein [Acidimicrobiaceae bacterium]
MRVVTENAAVDRAFDYELTDALAMVHVGDRVRVDFNNRSLRGWVTSEVARTREMKPVKKWLGLGPAPEMLPLLEWAAQRWCAPLSRFLLAASPGVIVRETLRAPIARPLDAAVVAQAVAFDPGVVLVSPTHDPMALILHAYQSTLEEPGSFLVLVPTEAWAQRLRGRLEQRGCAVAQGEGEWDRMRSAWPVIVGARGTALAPTPRVRAAVIVDADDEAYRSESSPTWDATSMLVERCRRDGAPLWLTSVAPSPLLMSFGPLHRWGDVSGGWPRVTVVDRREVDPHDGVVTRPALEAAHRALASDEPVALVVILQRLGHGRLYACRRCGELARCSVCAQGEVERAGGMACEDDHEPRANFCRACGATNLKKVRVGVSTLARDVAAQLSQPVAEVTASFQGDIHARVVVGTEAVFARVRRCAVVVFVDFDQYLLAPRESARRAALVAVAKAARLVGSRHDGRGEVFIQTRRHDDVVTSLEKGDVVPVIQGDAQTAQLLELPPYGARAQVSGEAASEFAARLTHHGLRVRHADGCFFVSAADVDTLTRILRETPRPPGRLRLEVF